MPAPEPLSSRPSEREPTHVMRFEVPLYIPDPPTMTDFDPVQDALHTLIALSRAAHLGTVCGDAHVSLIEWPNEPASLHDEEDDLRRAALWVSDNWDSQSSQHLSMPALRKALGRGDKDGRRLTEPKP